MDTFAPEPPAWDADTQATYERFVKVGGTPATWAAANPELSPPPGATAQPAKRALHPDDAARLNFFRAAWDYAAAKAWRSIGRR